MKNEILKQFSKLNSSQKIDLIKELKSHMMGKTKILSLRQSTISKCPHCKSDKIVKFGTYSGKKRYRCKECHKTFSELTGTSISYIKKTDKWFEFVNLMLENKTIREISQELNLSTKTVFEWRHKILNSFDEIFTKKFKGIVEIDEVYLPLNQKGRRRGYVKIETQQRGISRQQVSILVSTDRYKSMEIKVLKLGRIRHEDLYRGIDIRRLNRNNIICSDSHPSIGEFVRKIRLQHIQLNSRNERVRGIYHVQNINNITSEFKRWIHGNFNNVSTKYLQNYLNLYKMFYVVKKSKENKTETFLKYSLQDEKTFKRSKRMETKYWELLEYN